MTSNQNPQAILDVVDNKIVENKSACNAVSVWCAQQWKAILGEFVSTTFLILFGCMSCLPSEGEVPHSTMYAPFGFGLTVMFNIQIFGHLSGAHMNPSVTVAAVIWGSMSIPTGVAYFIAQCLGAIIGYGILMGLTPGNITEGGICVTLPQMGISHYQALGVEICLTAILVFVCCALWDPAHKNFQETVPIKFGLIITGLSIVGGPLTGAGMNPARSLGPALWSGVWVAHWVYWVGPLISSIVITQFYKIIWLKSEKN